jgi:hypothetical protein
MSKNVIYIIVGVVVVLGIIAAIITNMNGSDAHKVNDAPPPRHYQQ